MECGQLLKREDFSTKFKIHDFNKSLSLNQEYTVKGERGQTVQLSIHGRGKMPDNKEYVVFRIGNYEYGTLDLMSYTMTCTCIIHILNVSGEKKFPRTFEFQFLSKGPGVLGRIKQATGDEMYYEERCVERSSILNDEPEYLENDTLTVVVEGTVRQWAHVELRLCHAETIWIGTRKAFILNQQETGLEVYLIRDSIHGIALMHNSSVFNRLWDTPMRESKEKRVLLRNEELPAFLCMLFFIETKKLILSCKATILDLYKIAHVYDIPILLQECRKYFEKYLPKYIPAILEFATYFNDTELKKTAESYLHKYFPKTEESNLGAGEEVDNAFICDTDPVSSDLIKSECNFWSYFFELWKTWKNECKVSGCPGDILTFPISEEKTGQESFNFYA